MKKFVCITLILIMTMVSLPTFAADQKVYEDVKEGYWAKRNIEFISNNGYMVGYGSQFGILDNITEGQFVAVLCRILGYKNQSPLTTEEPARALGLIKDSESINITGNLKRNDMAKYSIRAFELLNLNVTYPDYLEAYKGLVTDYDQLNSELQTLVLKCVEKGLIAGGPDGRFDPGGESTRAQAAAIIHRLLSQDERNKAMPVFAEPDAEFEAFMASPEAEQYVSMGNVFKVIDGKLIYASDDKWGDYNSSLLPQAFNPESNKISYQLLKGLVSTARKHGHFVATFYNKRANTVLFGYYDDREVFQKRGGLEGTKFDIHLNMEPEKYAFEAQKENTNYLWEIHALFDGDIFWDGIMPKDINYQQDEFKEALEVAFKSVYGETLGFNFYRYAINEYNEESAWNDEGKKYMNTSIGYHDELDGLEVVNNSGYGSSTIFATNMKKGGIK